MAETPDLINHRILFLSEEITAQTANRLISQLLLLGSDDSSRPIDLYINCPGGSVTDGLAILDAMRCIRAPVSTICIGRAASMAAWILACGMTGQRFATPESEVMIHQVFSSFSGQTADIQVQARRLERMQGRLVSLMAQWTGRSSEKILDDMKLEFFMNAEEAKAYGIVDRILEPFEKRIPPTGP